jgi:hypothetical protein
MPSVNNFIMVIIDLMASIRGAKGGKNGFFGFSGDRGCHWLRSLDFASRKLKKSL